MAITRPPSASDDFIRWLFRNRCVICAEIATDTNEIVPRGRSKENLLDWKNRVRMCRKHHTEYHSKGVSGEAIFQLKQRRIEFLIAIGREDYV